MLTPPDEFPDTLITQIAEIKLAKGESCSNDTPIHSPIMNAKYVIPGQTILNKCLLERFMDLGYLALPSLVG